MFKGNLTDHLYNSLPKVYVKEDMNGTPLYRYLSSIVEGGYSHVLNDSNNILDLLDPQKCPDEFLQFFYRSFGLTYFPDIDPIYHRRLLGNLGGVLQRRGTYSCITFLARAVTGSETEIEYYRDENDEGTLKVQIISATLSQLNMVESEINVLNRFLREYVPLNIYNILVEGVVSVQVLEDLRNDSIVATSTTHYTLTQKPE